MTGRLVVTAFISLAVAAPVTYKITMAGDDDMHRQYVWIATAGLVAMTSLSLVGSAAQAEPLANSAAAPTPGGNEWLGRLVLIAVVAAAVGAFTALQLRAWSGRRRSPSGRSRDINDWRTLPPPPLEDDDPGPGEMPFGQRESYGPLWRYGAPRGYRRDYEPGCEPARGPGYGRDSDVDDDPGDGPGPGDSLGYGSGSGDSFGYGPGSGNGPGYGRGARRPRSVRGDESRGWRP
jgi:hypothetical protein